VAEPLLPPEVCFLLPVHLSQGLLFREPFPPWSDIRLTSPPPELRSQFSRDRNTSFTEPFNGVSSLNSPPLRHLEAAPPRFVQRLMPSSPLARRQVCPGIDNDLSPPDSHPLIMLFSPFKYLFEPPSYNFPSTLFWLNRLVPSPATVSSLRLKCLKLPAPRVVFVFFFSGEVSVPDFSSPDSESFRY